MLEKVSSVFTGDKGVAAEFDRSELASRRVLRSTASALLLAAALAGMFSWRTDASWRTFAVLFGSAVAAGGVGALLGLVFAIPRLRAEDASGGAVAGGAGRYLTNSNLEQISDWLTKILLGAGLVQLGQFPAAISGVADYLGEGITGGPPMVAALVVYGLAGGFILAYLWTRFRVRGLLEVLDADADSMAQRLRALLGDTYGPSAASADEAVVVKGEDRTDNAAEARKAHELVSVADRIAFDSGKALDAATQRALGRQLARVGDYEQAAARYQAAFEANPADPAPLSLAGVLLSRDLRRYDDAAAMYRRALEVDPNFVPALYNTACNEARRGNTEVALEFLGRAIAARPEKYRELAQRDLGGENAAFAGLGDDPRFRSMVGLVESS